MTVFVAGGALHPEKHPKIIIDRPELNLILDSIKFQNEYIILNSPRQTGKTTLLYQIQTQLHGNNYGVVYLDLSGFSNLNKAEFYRTVCTNIQKQLTDIINDDLETSSDAKNITQDTQRITNQCAFTDYLKFLAANTSQARKLIFMLDDINGIPEGEFLVLFATLRIIFNEGRQDSSEDIDLCRKLMFLFTGNVGLKRLTEGKNSYLRNICQEFYIKDFSKQQVITLGENLQNFSDLLREKISHSVYEWGSGHPYLTQRLFQLIDENQEVRHQEETHILEFINGLIEQYIKDKKDANLNYIVDYLRKKSKINSSCNEIVNKLLHPHFQVSGEHKDELETIGLIKKNDQGDFTIRNKMYGEVFKNNSF